MCSQCLWVGGSMVLCVSVVGVIPVLYYLWCKSVW